MAKNYPAFVNATGTVTKILEKIKVAATPDRFTQDYLATELGFSGGGARAFIPLAKKLGMLASDGAPTDLYKQFRNTNSVTSKAAMAKAIKTAYADVYARNEYVHSLNRSDLEGLIVEMTGLEKGNQTVRAIVGTFEALKAFADFKTGTSSEEATKPDMQVPEDGGNVESVDLKFGLSYTINLVLPKTDDVSVFNAIFRSLKENLLKK